MKAIDIEINKDLVRGCSLITVPNYEIWSLATKLQKIDFIIKKVIKDGYVQDYSEEVDQAEMEDIDAVILEYQYLESSYMCEIGEEKIIIRPVFPAEDYLKRKLFECIVDPASVYLKTAIENIESAEMNLSIGSIRSASSDIYYAVHNLLKSIQYASNRDEQILTSDTHPPLFLANIQQVSESNEDYNEKLKQSFNSQLGRVKLWLNSISTAIVNLEKDILDQKQSTSLEEFMDKLVELKVSILKECKARSKFENPHFNIYEYLIETQKCVEESEEVTELGKILSVLIIATYEARVLGDYKYNFESMLSRSYITLLFWFAEEFIKLARLKFLPMMIRRSQYNRTKISELHIVTNMKAKNSVLGIIKISDSSFDPIVLKDKFFSEFGKSLSIIQWEKEFPIKIQVLETSQVPITLEIHDSSQIDVYAPYNSEKASLDGQFKLIEDLIQKVYDFIIEDWPNAQVKVSPITLSLQHRLIKQVERQQRNLYYYRRIKEINLRKVLTGSKVNYSHGSLLRDFSLVLGGKKTNFIVFDVNHGPIMRYITDVVGNSIISRFRLSCERTIIFTNTSTYNQLQEKELLTALNEISSEFVDIADELWDKLSFTDFNETDAKRVQMKLAEKLEGFVFKEAAVTKE